MHIGFTGSRNVDFIDPIHFDRTEKMFQFFYDKWKEDINNWFIHHGDCVGADEGLHYACASPKDVIIIHPSNIKKWSLNSQKYFKRYDPKPPLERNKDIVNESDFLVAYPEDPEVEILRSGTWSTIRYARKVGKEVFIF